MLKKSLKRILTFLIVGTGSIVLLQYASANDLNGQPSCEQLTPAGSEQCIALSEGVCAWSNDTCTAIRQGWNDETERTGIINKITSLGDQNKIDFGNLSEKNMNDTRNTASKKNINNIHSITSTIPFANNHVIPFASNSQKNHKTKTPDTRINTLAFDCAMVTDVSTGECNALVAFYNTTNGADRDSGTNRLGYDDPTPETVCDRYGVSCIDNHVQQLYFYSNNLSGTLPSEIGNLNYLENLYLYYNNIPGLGTGIGDLTNLKIMVLFGNQLQSLPAEIGNLINLRELDIGYNEFDSLPEELRTLTGLQTLSLYGNELQSLPTGIENLTNLAELNLGYNQLNGSLTELRTLTGLKSLSLYDNGLVSLPTGIGNLTNLTGLNLGYNQLTGSLTELRGLTSLQNLSLYDNRLSSISTGIGNLTNLRELVLGYNNLSSLPENLWTLVRLENLYLYGNGLSSIPAEIGNLTNLIGLDVGENQLTSLPAEIWTLTGLENLYVYENGLESIPAGIGNLTNLVEFDASYNYLDSLPEEIRTLTGLESLYVYGDRLESIPAEIGNLVNLTELDLGYNRVSFLPDQISNLSSLEYLDLSDNMLTGVNESFGNLSNLRYVSLSYNELTSLPESFGALNNLEYLYLYYNALTSLPEPISHLSGLYYLNLSYNQITSLSSDGFSELYNLHYLYLSSSHISTIETGTFDTLSHLYTLNLSNNNIATLPDELCANLTSLTYLYLYNNELNSLPEELFDVTDLEYLNVYGNNLTEISTGISHLVNLNYLNISNNNIDSLPDEVFNLTNLEFLYANGNNLTEISTGISHLTQLNTLNLSNNEIASIPDERSDLTDLEYLYMDSNLLTTLSENTPSQMSGIYYISLSYNCFDTSLMSTGLIAFINDRSQGTSWQSHRNTYCSFEDNETERNSLITLYNATDGAHWNNNEYRLDTGVSVCSRYGISCEYDGIPGHIVGINLDNQGLVGAIPSEIGNIGGLQSLSLNNNELTSLPAQIDNLTHLTYLDVGYNQLTGLPIEISDLSGLQELYVNNNRLSGSLSDLCALTELNYLSIRYNDFIGDIPSCLEGLENIERGSMDYNYFNTDISDSDLLGYLDDHFDDGDGWRTQYIVADLSLSGVIDSIGGDFFVLDLGYANNSPKAIDSGIIYYDMLDGMDIVANQEFSTGEIEKTYGGFGDPCFDDLYDTTGIYLDLLNTSIHENFGFLGFDNLYEFLEYILDYQGDASEVGKFFIDYLMEYSDDNIDRQSLFWELGVDITSLPNCGTGGKNIYIFDMGTLQAGDSGNIIITGSVSSGLAANGFTSDLNIFSSNELRKDNMRLNNALSFTYDSGAITIEGNTSLFTDISQDTTIVTDQINLEETGIITTPDHDIIIHGDNIEALLPANTTIEQTGLSCLSNALLAPQDMSDQFPDTIKAFKIGSSCTGTTLSFSTPIHIRIYIEDAIPDDFTVKISRDGITWEDIAAVKINDHLIEITTDHFSYFKISEEETTNTQLGGGGSLTKDVCPADRDCSDSYYDKLCGKCTFVETIAQKLTVTGSGNLPIGDITDSPYSTELNNAYLRAYGYAITTMPTIQKANIEGTLIRKDMAKMISNFAINVLGKDVSTGAACAFTDMTALSKEAQYYAMAACRLGLMGYESDGVTLKKTFDPNQTVDRGQFGTILSRLLRGNENNGGTPYYQKHLAALKVAGIMTKIDNPNQKELRGRVMLMMQRVTEK